MKIPKCRTCGEPLTQDLNGDWFCMHSVIVDEHHDDCYPNPYITILKTDLINAIDKLKKHDPFGSFLEEKYIKINNENDRK